MKIKAIRTKINNFAEKYIAVPLYLILAGFAIILISEPYRVSKFMSLGTWLIFFAVVMGVFLKLLSKEKQTDDLWYLGLLVYSVVFSIIITKQASKSLFVSGAMFLELPFLLYYIDKRKRKNVLNFLFFVCIFLTCYFLLLRVMPIAHLVRGPYRDIYVEYITLGYNNPNQTAIYLLICMFVLLYGAKYFRNKILRLCCLILSLALLYLIVETNCRSVMVIAIVMALYFVFYSKIPIKEWMIILFFVLPIVWVLFILYGQSIYEKLSVFGDVFDTGRINIYKRVFYFLDMISAPFGSYAKFNFNNMHNAFMSIFATLGALGVCVFIFYMITKLLYAWNSTYDKKKRIPYFAILLLMIHGCMESSFFVAGSAYAVGFSMLFLLCNTTESKGGPLYEDTSRKLF